MPRSRLDQGSRSPWRRGGATALVLAASAIVRADDPRHVDEFLVVPLHVHVLTADDLAEIDCGLTDADLDRIVGKVNGVWRSAGVHFRVASRRREPAAGVAGFRALRALAPDRDPPLPRYRRLVPEATFTDDGLHVYYVHRLPVNGVYLGDRVAMVQEVASLREVEGGIDEPLPRVTSHELGHALGLSHRQARTNLMASGTTGTSLNAEEVETARAGAAGVPGASSVAALRDELEAARGDGEDARASELAAWIAEVEATSAGSD